MSCSIRNTEIKNMSALLYDSAITLLAVCPRELKTYVQGTPEGSVVKNLPATQEMGFDPWVRKIPLRRKWQPSPVFLPRESHGKMSLVSYSPWHCKESDMT